MNNDICSELDRTLEEWRQQCIVHNRQQVMAFRPGADRFNIRNHHKGIGWRLDKYSFGVRLTNVFHGHQIIRVHVACRYAKTGQDTL